MFFRNTDGHFGPMCIIINTDIFNIGKIIKIDKKDLCHKRCFLKVKIFMMVMIKWFYKVI